MLRRFAAWVVCHSYWGSRFDKHGFVLIGVLIPGDLEWRISNTMLIRHEALFIPPGSISPELDFTPPPA